MCMVDLFFPPACSVQDDTETFVELCTLLAVAAVFCS